MKEPPLGLPQYTEAVGREGYSTARAAKTGLSQHPVKSTNNAHHRFALTLRIDERDQRPESSRGGSSSPGIGREVVLRAIYPRNANNAQVSANCHFPEFSRRAKKTNRLVTILTAYATILRMPEGTAAHLEAKNALLRQLIAGIPAQ